MFAIQTRKRWSAARRASGGLAPVLHPLPLAVGSRWWWGLCGRRSRLWVGGLAAGVRAALLPRVGGPRRRGVGCRVAVLGGPPLRLPDLDQLEVPLDLSEPLEGGGEGGEARGGLPRDLRPG